MIKTTLSVNIFSTQQLKEELSYRLILDCLFYFLELSCLIFLLFVLYILLLFSVYVCCFSITSKQ